MFVTALDLAQDWDMFQTNAGVTSRMHAVARAISGGPVYISDKAGEHDTDIIRYAFITGTLLSVVSTPTLHKDFS
jgi:hypothetical protein